jgi:hypothetical protein
MAKTKKIFVVTQYVETDERGKTWRHAFEEEIGGSSNLLWDVERLKNNGAEMVLVCTTKKDAKEIAECWNDASRTNGTYGWAISANARYHAEEQQTA